MQLIGMLDSPYVRRVAITMQLLGLPYEHRSISVFSTYDQFRQINPLVKAPTLVCDDGEQLVDSNLIIDYLETLAGKSLMPPDLARRREELKLLGLALAACEKAVQLLYEGKRPAERQDAAWVARITEQLRAALHLLDIALGQRKLACDAAMGQAALTIGVCWRFMEIAVPGAVAAPDYPALAAHGERAERSPAFIAAPPP